MKTPSITVRLFLIALLLTQTGFGFAAPAPAKVQIQPTIADVAYGPDPKQKLDIYRPTTGKGPFPILLWIHGGGWVAGDKKGTDPTPYVSRDCAVVSVNYRLVADAVAEHVSPPIVAVLGDNRRALQYVRLHAAEWNLDPKKIVVGGSSAGACSALYLGCEGEQANPGSNDPVERVSTKVLGTGAEVAQASVDPKQIRKWVPGVIWAYWAFEPNKVIPGGESNFDQFLADRDKWMPYISKYSPDHLLTKSAPPIYFSYKQGLPKPSPVPTPSKQLVHSPLWAVGFQKLARERGVACYLKYPGHPSEKYDDMPDFLLHQLGLDSK